MELLFIIFLFLILLLAFAFVICGEWLIGRFAVVRRLRDAHESWGILYVGKDIPTTGIQLKNLGLRRVEELSYSSCQADVINKRFGDVVTVVCYKEKHLHHLTREIKAYSYLFLIFSLWGGLASAEQFANKSYTEIGHIILSHHFVPVFEVVMIIYITIRLFAEAQAINNLLDGE